MNPNKQTQRAPIPEEEIESLMEKNIAQHGESRPLSLRLGPLVRRLELLGDGLDVAYQNLKAGCVEVLPSNLAQARRSVDELLGASYRLLKDAGHLEVNVPSKQICRPESGHPVWPDAK